MPPKSVVVPMSCSKLRENKVFSAQVADIVSGKCLGNVQMFTHRVETCYAQLGAHGERSRPQAKNATGFEERCQNTPFYSLKLIVSSSRSRQSDGWPVHTVLSRLGRDRVIA
jgi:hypothetical protein